MKFFQLACRVTVAAGVIATGSVPANAEWGDLEGQFVLEGDIPAVKQFDSTKEEAVCGKTLPSEELVVNEKNKGIRYVFLFPAASKKPSKVHPDLAASKEKEIVFDQKKCTFLPHALFVRTDQTVLVKSSDPINHNTRTAPIRNQPLNVIITANQKDPLKVEFKGPESLPMQVKCDIHTWMSAWWLVLDHPYGAITDEDGKFKIEKLPVGDHEFRVWHEQPGYIEKAFKFTIKPGKNELPPIKVPVDKLK